MWLGVLTKVTEWPDLSRVNTVFWIDCTTRCTNSCLSRENKCPTPIGPQCQCQLLGWHHVQQPTYKPASQPYRRTVRARGLQVGTVGVTWWLESGCCHTDHHPPHNSDVVESLGYRQRGRWLNCASHHAKRCGGWQWSQDKYLCVPKGCNNITAACGLGSTPHWIVSIEILQKEEYGRGSCATKALRWLRPQPHPGIGIC